jgi:predicted dehydrogenase
MPKKYFLPLNLESSSLDRRQFLSVAGVAAGGVALTGCQTPGSAPKKTVKLKAKEKVRIAGIGAGGKGAVDIAGCAKAGAEIAALCDIDRRRLEAAGKLYPGAKLFSDYREMIEEMAGKIEGVTVSTPDHHHAPAAIRAIGKGMATFVQKPLTHTIAEARALTVAARAAGVPTLMGNQGHSGNDVRKFCELIWAGAIGPVRECHIWTNRPVWPQGLVRPVGEDPVPDWLDWEGFLGPAPWRPYVGPRGDNHRNRGAYHPWNWRGWWDFGTGALGDMACHLMDPARWALKLGNPISVEAESGDANDESAPNWSIITYEFPERDGMPPVKVVWYDGGRKPANELLGLAKGAPSPANGSLFIGDVGKMTCETYGGKPTFTPDSKVKSFPQPKEMLERSPGHYHEFVQAMEGKPLANAANFDYAGPFTEMVLLGNLAIRTERKVEWNSELLNADNMDVSHLVNREYRAGWEV